MDENFHELHCEHCHKVNCNVSNVCRMVSCRLECGFRFHECKSYEHSLVCGKETVPCINAVYGCPAKLKRSIISSHLDVCPASIIFCTMQWNRYPLYSRSRLSWVPFFQPNPVLVKGHLDVELALRDQKVLQDMFKKRLRKGKEKIDILRLNNGFKDGEDTEKNVKHVDTRRIDMAMALSALENKLKPLKFISEAAEGYRDAPNHSLELKTKQDEHDFNLELKVNDYERGSEMLRPDSPRAAILCANINSTTRLTTNNTDEDQLSERDKDLTRTSATPMNTNSTNEASKNTREILRLCLETNKESIKGNTSGDCQCNDNTKTTSAGNNRGNYCNYPSTQIDQSTADNNEKQTTGILNQEESRLTNGSESTPSQIVQEQSRITEVKETSNQIVHDEPRITNGSESTPSQLVQEESSITDVEQTSNQDDEEMEQQDLPKPPKFVDIYLKEPLGLNVMLETLPKFQKQAPLYSIPCNQVFRRDEYGNHFKNVHSEIHGGLNGWVEHRCPLAQYGCTFIHHRLLPNNQCGRVTFNKELGSFGVRHCIPNKDDEPFNKECPHHITMETDHDYLSSLPLEILETIADLLDGFTLCHLSRASKLFRQVCQRVLEKKGLVSLEWEKRIYDNGTWSWQVRHKKWFFSAAFSSVKTWVHSNQPGMASHLEKCPFFERYTPSERFCYQVIDSDINDCSIDDEDLGEDGLDIERHWQELREIVGMY